MLAHDAIVYMTSEADLRAVFETAFAHTRPGGVAIVIPDCTRETLVERTRHGGHDGAGRSLRYLEWTRDPDPADGTYEVDYVVALREGDAAAPCRPRQPRRGRVRARRLAQVAPGGRVPGVGAPVGGRGGLDSLRRQETVVTPAREVVELHIVSDSTGETAARLVAALEAQFPEQPFEEIRHPQIQTLDDLQLAVSRAKGRPAVMVYTLVDRGMREAMRTLCRSARLHYCDLLGHPIESIAKVSGMAARMTPGARPPLNSAYFKRMEAIEFAVKFDDGVGSGLREADVVLVGVSRTSKTPLSIYLGYLGQKAANVPIVKGIKPPPELFEIDPITIVGLTIDAERLGEIRATRVRGMGGENRRYAEMLEIYDELEEAAALHRRLGCPVIDVTGLSIEETAHRVIRLVDRRRQEAHA